MYIIHDISRNFMSKFCLPEKKIAYVNDTIYPCIFRDYRYKYDSSNYPSYYTMICDYSNVCKNCSYECMPFDVTDTGVVFISLDVERSIKEIESLLIWITDNDFKVVTFISTSCSATYCNELKKFMGVNLSSYNISSFNIYVSYFANDLLDYISANIKMLNEISIIATDETSVINCDDENIRNALYTIFMLSSSSKISIRYVAAKSTISNLLDSYSVAKNNTRHGNVEFIVIPASFIYGYDRDEMLDLAAQKDVNSIMTMINLTETEPRMNSKFLLF